MRPSIAALLGAILGVAVVRLLLLDAVEEMGWRMFWEGLADGRVMDIGKVLSSTTFLKSVLGATVGAIGGRILATRLRRRPPTDERDEEIDKIVSDAVPWRTKKKWEMMADDDLP